MSFFRFIIVIFCVILCNGNGMHSEYDLILNESYNISYDSRSILIDGNNVILYSGGMHYARGTPTQWDNVMKLAKNMNLNNIQTYFMWNIHEPYIKGDISWSGLGNITQFLELAIKHKLYITLRIGPYVCGEWNYGV